jgi:hypothetical protein
MSHPPRQPNRVTGLARTTILTVTVALGGCRAPEPASFAGITPGMSQEEVIVVLGPPSSQLRRPEDDADQKWHERWHWGDTLGTLATNVAMPNQPPPARLWTVWFDDSGKVLSVESPRPQLQDTPWLPPAIAPR